MIKITSYDISSHRKGKEVGLVSDLFPISFQLLLSTNCFFFGGDLMFPLIIYPAFLACFYCSHYVKIHWVVIFHKFYLIKPFSTNTDSCDLTQSCRVAFALLAMLASASGKRFVDIDVLCYDWIIFLLDMPTFEYQLFFSSSLSMAVASRLWCSAVFGMPLSSQMERKFSKKTKKFSPPLSHCNVFWHRSLGLL